MMLLRHYMLDLVTQEANIFLMANDPGGDALVVDAGGFSPELAENVNHLKLKVTHILITHLDWDHVDGLGKYLKIWPEAQVITPAPLRSAPDARIVAGGDRFEAAGFWFDALDTSGHTPESISYYCTPHHVCFVGDAIFAGALGGVGNDQLFEEERGNIMQNIATLPPRTELYPGHGPMSTVAVECAANPFLQPGFGRTA